VYNFAQLPLVRGYDAWWLEKQAGNKSMPPAEPLGSIHMPSPSYIPVLMALGFFIAGLGLIARDNFAGAIIGLALVVVCLFLRSFDRDHGYHIEPKKIEDVNRGVKA
jgi:cytochrome c oxidase subunit 1